ncbi:conjugal transfer protein [Pseudarthrobacter sp. J47]|nr:conjugal transfer protein [Pseudarthrobacter sp. J47]
MTEKTRSATTWKRIFRVFLIVVLSFAVISGVRSWFNPTQNQKSLSVPVSATFPTAAAGGVAERFAVNYFTWEEGNGTGRAAALSQDMAGSGEGTAAGWDGKGKQEAASPYVVGVDVHDSDKATVTVAVTITPYSRDPQDAKKWVVGKAQGMALEVPVRIADNRVIVTGNPGAVALPAPGKVDAPNVGTDDSQLTSATKEYAKQFFAAYGKDRDTSAITAPEANIPGLAGAMEFKDLTGWTVEQAGGDTRQGRATVRWAVGASTIEQTFTVTLTKVTGAGAERWQVSQLVGGN